MGEGDGRRLFLRGRELVSDYQLLGSDENALTCALGHCLSHDAAFLAAFMRWCGFKGASVAQARNAEIHLQSHSDEGITDLEVIVPDRIHLIVEAKVGGGFPTHDQIERYIDKLPRRRIRSKVVVLTQTKDAGAASRLKKSFQGSADFRTWSGVVDLASDVASRPDSTFDIRSLTRFMKEVYGMTLDAEVEVWVVSLTHKKTEVGIDSVEFTLKRGFYAYPMSWSRPPCLYVGFRYDGHLRFFARVVNRQTDVKPEDIDETVPASWWSDKPHCVLRFGDLIPFPNTPKSGNLWNQNNVFCDFDLLLSCQTVAEARRKTSERRRREETMRRNP